MSEYITMQDCLRLDLKDAIAQRDNLQDQRDFAISEMDRLKRERDEARKENEEQAKLLAMSADREEKLRMELQQARDCFSAAMEPAERYKTERDAIP